MAHSITHRDGSMEADPPVESFDSLLGELDAIDAEHPDVAVSHESGWTLSAFPSGRLLYEDTEESGQEPRQLELDRRLIKSLFPALAAGDLERLESEDWQPTEQVTFRTLTEVGKYSLERENSVGRP